jgi:NRPS condensation-like uncharacterized protein
MTDPLPQRSIDKAALLAALRRGARPIDVGAGIVAAGPMTSAPASSLQEAAWRTWATTEQRSRSGASIPFAGLINGQIDKRALASAVVAVADRHEALRTYLTETRTELVQNIAPTGTVELSTEAVNTASGVDAALYATERANTIANEICNPSTPPLTRVVLIEIDHDRHLLLLKAHHLIADGYSLGVAFAELAHAYGACRTHAPISLPELPIQYRDYAIWQRTWMRGDEAAEHARYWTEQLADVPPVDLAACEFVTHREVPTIDVPDFHLSSLLSEQVRAFARRSKVSVFAVLLAAYAALLREWSGVGDLSIGTPVSNRRRPETRPLIGYFAGAVFVRLVFDESWTFTHLLQHAKHETARAVSHEEMNVTMFLSQRLPFGTNPERPSLAGNINLQPPIPPLTLGGADVTPVELEREDPSSRLAVGWWNEGPRIRANIGWQRDAIATETVQRAMGRLVQILQAACEEPGKRLRGL